MIVGVKRNWGRKRTCIQGEEGIVKVEIEKEEKKRGKVIVISVYNRSGGIKVMKNIEELIEGIGEREKILIGSDFNIRIGNIGIEEV